MVCLFWAFAALVAAAWSQQTNNTAPRVEIDVVFPRNETYKPAENIPIVLAVQNLPATDALGNFSVQWSVALFTNTGVVHDVYDQGGFQVLDSTPAGGPAFLLASTNFTRWWQRHPGRLGGPGYMLSISATWRPVTDKHCYEVAHISVGDAVAFYVQFHEEGDLPDDLGGNSSALPVDLLQAPACPLFAGAAILATNTAKGACPVTMQPVAAAAATPCAVTVDKPVASSLSSRTASLAAKTSTTIISTTTNKAGGGAARTVQTALAAACVLCGLKFS